MYAFSMNKTFAKFAHADTANYSKIKYHMVQNSDGRILTIFLAIHQNFTIQNFLPTASCLHVGLIQFIKILLVKFFLAPNSSKFSTVKI